MHNAVGLGDMKQGVEQLFENRRPVGEHFCDLFGVGFEPAGILARHVEHATDVFQLFFRHVEDLAERLNFVGRNLSVSLGHFGAKGDNCNGEGGLTGGVAGIFVGSAETVHGMTCRRTDQRTQRPSYDEAANTADNLTQKRHAYSPRKLIPISVT